MYCQPDIGIPNGIGAIPRTPALHADVSFSAASHTWTKHGNYNASGEPFYKNIATGETSQAVTPFHFFRYSKMTTFFYHWITSLARNL